MIITIILLVVIILLGFGITKLLIRRNEDIKIIRDAREENKELVKVNKHLIELGAKRLIEFKEFKKEIKTLEKRLKRK